MDWLATPSAWSGLVMLLVIQLVLGARDVAVIEKHFEGLPAEQRRRAHYTVALLGLGAGVALLVGARWILAQTAPLFVTGGSNLSARDLLLVAGGLFLIAKSASQIRKRVIRFEDVPHDHRVANASAQAVTQVIVVGVMFLLVFTATAMGLSDYLMVMVIAFMMATVLSTVASKPIGAYLARHPSIVVLCLAIVLAVGFGLLIDGLGYGLPKASLQTMIGLVLLMEGIGQFRGRSRNREFAGLNLRERATARMMKLLGRRRHRSRRTAVPVEATVDETVPVEEAAFAAEEADIIQGVLTLAERPVRTIMSPRADIQWVAIDRAPERIRADILRMTHSVALLCRGRLNDFVGVAATTDLLRALVEGREGDLSQFVRQPVVVHEGTKVLRLMEELRKSPMPVAIVLDEYGSVAGVATPTDILETIAGDFPDRGETPVGISPEDDGSTVFEGFVDIHRVSSILGTDLADTNHRYSTLNGYVVWKLSDIPREGQRFAFDGMEFEILAMKGRNIDKVRVRHAAGEEAMSRPTA